jgi:ABC-2 type transport system permease protein
MKKAWVFFKLRLVQMKYDKTGIFFSYIFPIVLLLGIGYPLEMSSNQEIEVSYLAGEVDPSAKQIMDAASKHDLIEFVAFPGTRAEAEKKLTDNEIQHLLKVSPASSNASEAFEITSNSLGENRVAALALTTIIMDSADIDGAARLPEPRFRTVDVSKRSSYIAVLLPGVIAMTLLVIGLSGFGGVLIEEEALGLYRNLKTIDASPVPFFAGLFMSRMLVAYSVAIGMFLVSVLVLDVPSQINYPLLLVVVTLGCSCFLALGLVIFLFSKTVMAFNGIVSVIQLPLVLLGGVFFSITMFPDWLRVIAQYSPLAPFTSALRDLMFGGVGFHNASVLLPALITMSVWLVVTLLFSKWRFRW